MADVENSSREVPHSPELLHHLSDRTFLLALGVDPDGVGLVDGTERLTFAEYADAVVQLAGVLNRAGSRRGERIAIHLRKSVHSFVAVHAALRAGGVVVPLDPMAPLAHVRAVLADARASTLVTDVDPEQLGVLVAGTDVIAVVSRGVGGRDAPSDAPRTEVVGWSAVETSRSPSVPEVASPDDPAYIIYTSGSTGAPKGIVHTHRSALAYARLAAETYGLRPTDRLANIAPLHFDQSTFELYAGLLAGASVLVVPDAVLRFPASTSELIARERATVVYSVPHVFRQLAARGALDQRDMSAVRWILFGGEPYAPKDLTSLMSLVPSARFSNVYGPAEVNQCTFHHLRGAPRLDRPVPIGRAWPETELLVVDSNLRPVAAGEHGELLVSTSTMMSGYWLRPDLTASTIMRIDGAAPWYRTGDLVHANEDGELVFLGRVDQQVKIRGQRIEIEAVEAALLDIDEIHECGVVVDHGPNGTRLVAAVLADVDTDTRAVVRRLAARLPSAAVPASIVPVDRLPRTASGKVDRHALSLHLGLVSHTQSTSDGRPRDPYHDHEATSEHHLPRTVHGSTDRIHRRRGGQH